MNKQTFIGNSENPELAKAVIKQLGGWASFKESAPDISNHGIGGGFSGFIYHTDTVKFFKKNKPSVMQLAQDQANEFGSGMFEMIASFGCLNGAYSVDEIAQAIHTNTDDSTQVRNALAWYAGEEIAREYANQ